MALRMGEREWTGSGNLSKEQGRIKSERGKGEKSETGVQREQGVGEERKGKEQSQEKSTSMTCGG